jgi:hypothetical protein
MEDEDMNPLLGGGQQRGGQLVPHSRDLGTVEAPWNVPKTVFRYMASVPVTIKGPVVYCGDIITPSGAGVTVEAWMNGSFVGEFVLARGKNPFNAISLKAFDKIELRIVTKGTGDPAPATVSDLWVMFCT